MQLACTATFLENITSYVLAPKTSLFSFSFQQNNSMRSHRALVALFGLILMHFFMSSLLCLHHEIKIHPVDRNQPRRLLLSVSSLSSNINKYSGGTKDPQKAVGTSLRKAPPSLSNPTQNK